MRSVRKNIAASMSAAVAVAMVLTCFTAVFAQKTEHYNSPLYSPKTYDPTASVGNGLPDALKTIGIEQRLGQQLPMTAEFKDEDGNLRPLGDYFKKDKPVIIAFVYYECPMLCNQVLNGLSGSLKGISFDAGKDFDVVAISFDARENEKSDLAKNKKASYLERYGRADSESGWHFLTGTEENIALVTQAAGFHFKWDEKTNQFAHAGGVMVTTPDGKMSRYFYGIDYAPKDLKLGLIESGENKVGNPAEQLLLYCYHYDPSTGRYGLAVLNLIRIGGVITILGLGAMALVFWRLNKRKAGESE